MYRGYFHKKALNAGTDADAPMLKSRLVQKRKSKREAPGPDEIATIVYKVVVQKLHQCDVAKQHNVSPAMVSLYVRKAKKNQKYLELISQKETAQATVRAGVTRHIQAVIDEGLVINRAQDILDHMPKEEASSIKIKMVRQALKEDFNMTHRKITKLSP